MATKSARATPSVVVDADLNRKILRVRFCGAVRPPDTERYLAPVATLLPKLGRGFAQVTDLTELEQMDLDCVSHVTRMMDACVAAGLANVVRIVPDPQKDIGFNLLSLVHYRGRVHVVTCASRAEAEVELARIAP